MNNLPLGPFNLPPGTTERDIEEAEWAFCAHCGREFPVEKLNDEICPACQHRMEPEDKEDR